ncbi:nucleotide exchange factor GrpE [Pseudoclavibacter endophyticus]|uniref:Protein GrpE n=1 Tax=Pseudoclavibacter endophyticus TaxID=1778590 RepID=A0A6H9WUB9_9MICO|nr:nucleotide exchange factor GrpE [Pseudoclavibacter endophyticus]
MRGGPAAEQPQPAPAGEAGAESGAPDASGEAPDTGADAAAAAESAAGSEDAADADSQVIDDELERLIADARAVEEAGTASAVDDESRGEPDTGQSADAARADATLADLQRVTAEYANYRRRTEQEKIAAREATTGEVLRALLPVLDDLDRAEQHGDLPEEGAVAVIASKLRASVEKLGLVAYGDKGERFDPTVHEAIAQLPSPEAEADTIADVVERGYRVGDRIVRVAKVAVFVAAS